MVPVAMRKCTKASGVTLVELVLVIILLSVLGTVVISTVGDSGDAARYEETRRRMEELRRAILGDDTRDPEGKRQNFGYHGDLGQLPSKLTDLITPQAPAWSYNSTYGVASGWRGPYLKTQQGAQIDKDVWGKSFDYQPKANPPFLRSLGSDGVAGGVLYGQDLQINFPTNERLSTVRGIVTAGDLRLAGRTVEIRYPVAGVLTMTSAVTDANGSLSFPNIPFGVRALNVTNPPPAMGPKQIVVDSSDYLIPNSMLNYHAAAESMSWIPGSDEVGGIDENWVFVGIKNDHSSILQAKQVTVTWDRTATATEGYLTRFSVGGEIQAFNPPIVSGTTFPVNATQIFLPNTPVTSLELRFSKNANGTGELNYNGCNFWVTFQWTTNVPNDTVFWNTPCKGNC